MKLTTTRTVTTTFAMTTIAAVAFAASAQADPAPFNGSYSGGDDQNLWTVSTSCPTEGCTGTVASNQGWSVPATMTNGLWTFTLTKPDGVICDDGSDAPAYISMSVDPNTLNGALATDSNGNCPGGQITRTPFTLTKVG
jgi:hypothetical protein